MAVRKLFIVWNPAAGGKSKQILHALSSQLSEQGLDFHVFDTDQTKSATLTVQAHLDNTYTELVIIGGDGTINESINGLTFSIPVSIIPAGTGDDFIKMVRIGRSLEEQIQTVINGRQIEIDLGICNDRKFINGVGIGFDGQIVEDMVSKRVPLLRGHAAYYYHVLRILWGYKPRNFLYQLNDTEYSKDLILLTIGNGSTFGGGFQLVPLAKIDDGLLSVCTIGQLSSMGRFLNIHKLSSGTHGSLPMIQFHETKELYLEENAALFAHIDGERMGSPPFHVRILPKALRLTVAK